VIGICAVAVPSLCRRACSHWDCSTSGPFTLASSLSCAFLIYPASGASRARAGPLGWIIDGTLDRLPAFWWARGCRSISTRSPTRSSRASIDVVRRCPDRSGGAGGRAAGRRPRHDDHWSCASSSTPSPGAAANCRSSPTAMPGILNHRGYSLDRLASQMVLGAEGIFGIPLGRRRHVHLYLRPVRRVSGSHRCGQVLHRSRLCRHGAGNAAARRRRR
jgi:hypothetical protein